MSRRRRQHRRAFWRAALAALFITPIAERAWRWANKEPAWIRANRPSMSIAGWEQSAPHARGGGHR